jgi:hypothetical protein
MTLIRVRLLLICGSIAYAGQVIAAGAGGCVTETRLPIVLRLASATGTATATPTAAFLIGDLTPGLRIVDARSGRLLWTAGAAGAYTQRFAGMTAGFTASLAAIDTDGDGAHDRIYAGDLRGRLWRFDIDARGPASSWVAGGIFADLGGGAPGRGFLAAPDLTLIAPVGQKPWLSIALGTANTTMGPGLSGSPRVLNRFYVLRDRAPFARWTQRQYELWTPLVEGDLLLAEGAHIDITPAVGAGFYINLGAQQVVAAALTLDGNTLYTTAATNASLLPTCNAPAIAVLTSVSVGSISAVDGSLNAMDLRDETIQSAPATAAITLVRDGNSATGALVCEVAGQPLPACSIDAKLHRSFWRREDAD